MAKNSSGGAPSLDPCPAVTTASQARHLLLADGVTPLPLHGPQVWQGPPWELAALLLGSVSLVWIAVPAP